MLVIVLDVTDIKTHKCVKYLTTTVLPNQSLLEICECVPTELLEER